LCCLHPPGVPSILPQVEELTKELGRLRTETSTFRSASEAILEAKDEEVREDMKQG
jgi:hypothetical protein